MSSLAWQKRFRSNEDLARVAPLIGHGSGSFGHDVANRYQTIPVKARHTAGVLRVWRRTLELAGR